MSIGRPDGGRITLFNDILRIFMAGGNVEERKIGSLEEFKTALVTMFGIRLPSA